MTTWDDMEKLLFLYAALNWDDMEKLWRHFLFLDVAAALNKDCEQ